MTVEIQVHATQTTFETQVQATQTMFDIQTMAEQAQEQGHHVQQAL
jgi:hypothetical protein